MSSSLAHSGGFETQTNLEEENQPHLYLVPVEPVPIPLETIQNISEQLEYTRKIYSQIIGRKILSRAEDNLVQLYNTYLDSPDEELREEVSWRANKWKSLGQASFRLMDKALNDPSADVRSSAATSLEMHISDYPAEMRAGIWHRLHWFDYPEQI